MSVVDSLYKGYGDGAPFGTGPDPVKLVKEGETRVPRSEFRWSTR